MSPRLENYPSIKLISGEEFADNLFDQITTLGAEVEIPCLDGMYKVKVEPGTQSGTVVRLRGKGLPTVNGYGGTGDLYVKFAVWIPKRLSKEEKELVEALRNKDGFKPNPSKEDKSFFDRLKDLF